MNYELLTGFLLATALLSLSPGPDNLYVLTQSLTHGKKFGLATTAGLMTGCLVHTTLLALGVSALIKELPILYFGIKLFGAAYLIFLAYQTYQSDASVSVSGGQVPKKGLWKLYRQGFIMNVLNPKVTIFFLAFFPGFLFSQTLGLVAQFYILGFLFILVSFSVFAAVALLAGSIATYLKRHEGTGVLLKWLQVVVFLAIAAYLLLSEN